MKTETLGKLLNTLIFLWGLNMAMILGVIQ